MVKRRFKSKLVGCPGPQLVSLSDLSELTSLPAYPASGVRRQFPSAASADIFSLETTRLMKLDFYMLPPNNNDPWIFSIVLNLIFQYDHHYVLTFIWPLLFDHAPNFFQNAFPGTVNFITPGSTVGEVSHVVPTNDDTWIGSRGSNPIFDIEKNIFANNRIILVQNVRKFGTYVVCSGAQLPCSF